MGRSRLHDITFPKVIKFMSETDKAVTGEDIANYLGMSEGGVWNIMQLMELFKMVQKVKRGRTYYVLSGLSDEQIDSMLPPRKVAPIRRRRSRSQRLTPPIKNGVGEYISAVRAKIEDGLSALSMIGLKTNKDKEAEDQ